MELPVRTSSTLEGRSTLVGMVLLWGLLLSPLALWIHGAAFGWRDPLFLFNLGTSLLWVAALHFGFSRPFWLHLGLLPLYATTAVDLFLLAAFDSRLSSGYIGIAMSDHADAGEMVSSYLRYIIPTAVTVLTVYGAGLWFVRGAILVPRRRVALVALVLLMCIYGMYLGRLVLTQNVDPTRAALDLAQKENSAPTGVVFQAALALDIRQRGAVLRDERRLYRHNARQIDSETSPEIIVVVIGESSRPQNWSLFGYDKQTTPNLQRQAGLIPLPDLLSTAPHTAVAVPSMLSLQGIDQWDLVQSRSSIVAAFGEAGFRTHWISAQPADSWAGLVPTVAQEAQHSRYYDHQHDGILLSDVDAVLAANAAVTRQLLVVHTKGSHFEYDRRYPKAFEKFKRGGVNTRDNLIADYDNSILYTDWFLSEVIKRLEKSGRRTAMIYASDHGENLYDDQRAYFGHAIGTEFDLRSAGFLWLSESLRQADKARYQRVARHSLSAISLSDLSHTLLDLAGINAKELQVTRSLFSPTFLVRTPRQYHLRGHLKTETGLQFSWRARAADVERAPDGDSPTIEKLSR